MVHKDLSILLLPSFHLFAYQKTNKILHLMLSSLTP